MCGLPHAPTRGRCHYSYLPACHLGGLAPRYLSGGVGNRGHALTCVRRLLIGQEAEEPLGRRCFTCGRARALKNFRCGLVKAGAGPAPSAGGVLCAAQAAGAAGRLRGSRPARVPFPGWPSGPFSGLLGSGIALCPKTDDSFPPSAPETRLLKDGQVPQVKKISCIVLLHFCERIIFHRNDSRLDMK